MNLDEIRARKLAAMQTRAQERTREDAQFASQVAQLEAIIKTRMTKDAIARLGNVKTAHPERAVQAIAVMAQLIQAGRIATVDDATLKDILERLQPEKKGFRITRK